MENQVLTSLLTENVIKQIAKEVVRINEERKAKNKRIDYMAEKVFEQAREKYAVKINKKFMQNYDEFRYGNWKLFTCETSDIWNDIRKTALKAAGIKSERQAYLEGKGEIANAFAEELCEAILKERE